jgi:hypothetical protein
MPAAEDRTSAAVRVRGPGDLVQVIPYLLGFHPVDSVVLVGFAAGRVMVTARADWADVDAPVLQQMFATLRRGGAREIVAVGYGSDRSDDAALLAQLDEAEDVGDVDLIDVLTTRDGRWRSLRCDDPYCCPPGGRALNSAASPIAAAATFAGLVALPHRGELERLVRPVAADTLAQMAALVASAEQTIAPDGPAETRWRRATVRAVFAACRAAEPDYLPLADAEVARFGAALRVVPIRDAVWLAIDDGRLSGDRLWLDLCRRLPDPHAAAPAFLAGWQAWRAGNGSLARIAAERACGADPASHAADLLLGAIAAGADPRRVPRLRRHGAQSARTKT